MSVPDAAFAALDAAAWAPDMRGARLELYLARVAVDHGQKALAALRYQDTVAFEAHLLAYGRIARGLIASRYWHHDAALQTGWGQPCA